MRQVIRHLLQHSAEWGRLGRRSVLSLLLRGDRSFHLYDLALERYKALGSEIIVHGVISDQRGISRVWFLLSNPYMGRHEELRSGERQGIKAGMSTRVLDKDGCNFNVVTVQTDKQDHSPATEPLWLISGPRA